jgi:carbohydrate-selective porin OprB
MSRFSDVGNEREALVELSYQVPIMSYLKLQPDLQWISRPGASREFDNAWVIGLRAIVEF